MDKEIDRIVRVGIAGLGRSGWNIHASILESMVEKYQVVAVCDGDQGRHDLYATLRKHAPLAVTPESIQRQIAVLEKCRELSPV